MEGFEELTRSATEKIKEGYQDCLYISGVLFVGEGLDLFCVATNGRTRENEPEEDEKERGLCTTWSRRFEPTGLRQRKHSHHRDIHEEAGEGHLITSF